MGEGGRVTDKLKKVTGGKTGLPADHDARTSLVTDLATSFAVGAGAGSGKTRVLVDRIIQLVDSGRELDRIVAITFTEKAAAELRERVRVVLADPSADVSQESSEHRRKALGKVDLAQLTTIHSFCRSILARHPLEAGITPGFTILDALQSDLLLDKAGTEVIEEMRTVEDSDLEGALIAGGSLDGLRNLVKAIRRYPDLEPEIPEFTAESSDLILHDLFETAEEIVSCADGVPSDDTLLSQARDALRLKPLITAGVFDPHDRVTLLEGMVILKNAGRKDNWKTNPDVEAAFSRLKPEWISLRVRRDEAKEQRDGQHLGYFISKAKLINKTYERRKSELGALDFDDLLVKTAMLLETEREVAREIKKGFATILVDEFQDTDPVQAQIVQRLAEAVDDHADDINAVVPEKGRLFLVGDANQSIYRFRRADRTVFRDACSRLLENGVAERLDVNFRSTPGLVTVANRIFGDLLEKGEYRDLVPFREVTDSGPVVTLLDIDGLLPDSEQDSESKSKPSAIEMRKAEATALAGWIHDRIESGMVVQDKVTGEFRPMGFGDVAVLVRTYTGVEQFENIFDLYGIPYRISGGKAFFNRLEILQTLPALKAVANPDDQTAVVAAFRSPCFGVSDESLVRWAGSGYPFAYNDLEDRPVDETFVEENLDAESDVPLLEARQILAELNRDTQTFSPSGILWRLFERTRALPLHALKPDGDRRIANLLKLLDLSLAYEEAAAGLIEGESEEQVSLDGLVRFFEEQRKAAVEEESALADAEGDMVQIMTIHSAKGLEFPVVALLDRAYAPTFRDEAIPDRSSRTASVKGAGFKPPDWDRKKEAETAEQEAEAKRLLYVAFTRARDHVVTCGSRSTDSENLRNGKQFLAPLEAALKDLVDKGEEGNALNSLVEWTSPSVPDRTENLLHRLPMDLEEPSASEIEDAVGIRREVEEKWHRTVNHALRSVVTRASDLTPRKDLLKSEEASLPDGETQWFARLRGIRVHAAMELIALHGADPSEACCRVSEPGDPPDLQDHICRYLESGAGMLEKIKSEGWNPVAAEWPLLLGGACEELAKVVPDWVEILTGTADLILQNREENLLVVDYKTGVSGPEELLQLYEKQLIAYRCMLQKSSGKPVSAEIWSLSTEERLQLP